MISTLGHKHPAQQLTPVETGVSTTSASLNVGNPGLPWLALIPPVHHVRQALPVQSLVEFVLALAFSAHDLGVTTFVKT